MKRIKITTVCLALLLLVCAFGGIIAFAAEGMTFAPDEIYKTESPLSELPKTYEATLRFPADFSGRGGVVLGNYYTSKNTCFNFEIYEGGKPRLYMIDNSGNICNVVFDGVNVYTGEWVHIAIVKNSEEGTLSCYLGGELAQTLSVATPDAITFGRATVLGGDNRSGNVQYFKGALKTVAIYNDVRTAEELRADSAGGYGADGLLGFYDLSAGDKTVTDASGAGPAFIADTPFLYDYEGTNDYAYSFAVVGDTQIMTLKYPDKLSKMYDWIVENAESKNIKFVFGLGDITDRCTDAEWAIAKKEISKLDGVIPYSIIRGNHDRFDNCYNEYFPYSEYEDRVDGSLCGTMNNTYQKFSVGNIKYLVVNLDFTLSDAALAWANEVVAAHPDYNVIVTTHIYLQANGNTIDQLKYGSINTGEQMWEKFVSRHENIVLVLAGHAPTEYIKVTRSQGECGNEVVQMLVDPQETDKNLGGVGLVAMLYFSEDGRQVDVEYYSTAKEAFYREENQFHIELNVIESQPAVSEVSPLWLLALIPIFAAAVATTVRDYKRERDR